MPKPDLKKKPQSLKSSKSI